MLLILLIILILHLIMKKINIEHLTNYNNTDYYNNQDCIDNCKIEKCKNSKKNIEKEGVKFNIKCSKNCYKKCNTQTNKIKKERLKKRVGCLKSKDNIKLPLYKEGNKLYYSYDDDTINYNKLKSIKKEKKRNKLANKWYKKLLKSKNTDNLQELPTMKRVKSNDCKKSLRRNINDVQIIFNKKCKTKKKKCKKYV